MIQATAKTKERSGFFYHTYGGAEIENPGIVPELDGDSISRSSRLFGVIPMLKYILYATAICAGLFGAAMPAHAQSQPANGTYRCGPGWSPISAGANTYIVGNCASGTILHRTWTWDNIQNGPYTGGQIYGSFNGCGAVQTKNLGIRENSLTWTACSSSARRDPSTFLSYVDCRSDQPGNCTWDTTLSGDTETQVLSNCPSYANVRPFSSTPTPVDQVQSIWPGKRVYWRYITRDGNWVMAHDFDHGLGEPSYIFVARGCVTTPHAVTP